MLKILGLLFIAALAVAGMGLGYWVHQDRQARAFVSASLPLIYKEWSADALTRRAATGLRTAEFEAQVREMFQLYGSELGPLESSEPPEGSMRYGQPASGLRSGLLGQYASSARFKNGDARLELTVIKEEGLWRIAAFRVSSPKLLAAMKQQKPAKNPRSNYVRGPPDEEAAVLAKAEQAFQLMDSEDPGAAWSQGSLPFQQAKPKRRFVDEVKRMREATGNAQTRQLEGVGFQFKRANANPPGDYAVADYLSTYSRMQVRERLGFYRHEDGPWQFSGHQWTRVDEPRP